MNKLQVKRGNNANLGALTLSAGEPAFVLDTGKLYIGNGTDKVLINADSVDSASMADKLTNSRTINISGDATGSTVFDGSADVTANITLANSGVTAGTYSKVTVDIKGRVIGNGTLAAADIPTLTVSKISDAGTAAVKNTGTGSGNIPILDTNGKLADSVIPSIALSDTFEVATEVAMLALTAQTGDVAVRSDISKTFILKASPASSLINWVELKTPTDIVLSVAGRTGVVTLTKSDVGLGNVDNTADANKAVLSTTKLTTARTINGVSFDGTANISIADSTKEASLGNPATNGYLLSSTTAGTRSWVAAPVGGVTSVASKTGAVTLAASDVGLGNVTNESKATMFTSAALTGAPTAPTAVASTNTTQVATTAYVVTALSVIDGGTF